MKRPFLTLSMLFGTTACGSPTVDDVCGSLDTFSERLAAQTEACTSFHIGTLDHASCVASLDGAGCTDDDYQFLSDYYEERIECVESAGLCIQSESSEYLLKLGTCFSDPEIVQEKLSPGCAAAYE